MKELKNQKPEENGVIVNAVSSFDQKKFYKISSIAYYNKSVFNFFKENNPYFFISHQRNPENACKINLKLEILL